LHSNQEILTRLRGTSPVYNSNCTIIAIRRQMTGFLVSYIGSMVLALLLVAGMADWVPARWASGDPKTLDLVSGTPVNCVLLEESSWSASFAEKAKQLGIATLGVVRPGGGAAALSKKAIASGLTGVALEGDFEDSAVEQIKPLVEINSRRRMKWNSGEEVIATYQGLWPGIQIQEGGAAKAAPSGGPWIDTNTGFLRFARVSTAKSIWIANAPPPKTLYSAERYLQAIGDAAIAGARWVLAFDDDFTKRLLERESMALRDWKRISQHLRYFEEHKEWAQLKPAGRLALVQDIGSGALVSGGILDMIAVKHTPVRPVPGGKLSDDRMRGAKMAVNVDPASLTEQQKEVLRRFTSAGGTMLSGPPGWKFPSAQGDAITLSKEDLQTLDSIWREMNSMTGRRNLGARLFNVSSMLSNLLESADGKSVILHLVNYSNYPVDSITVHLLGEFKKARLYTPEGPPQDLKPFPVEEGTGIEIDKVVVVGTVVLE
jgi:hypothetical protein